MSSALSAAQFSTASRGRNTRLRTYLTPVSTEPFSQPFAGAQELRPERIGAPERRERLGLKPVPAG